MTSIYTIKNTKAHIFLWAIFEFYNNNNKKTIYVGRAYSRKYIYIQMTVLANFWNQGKSKMAD